MREIVTAQQLVEHFNSTFGINAWPLTYHVDAETYANACQYVFNHIVETQTIGFYGYYAHISLSIGVTNNGLMFKGVELILEG
jgi:hypothetical protein